MRCSMNASNASPLTTTQKSLMRRPRLRDRVICAHREGNQQSAISNQHSSNSRPSTLAPRLTSGSRLLTIDSRVSSEFEVGRSKCDVRSQDCCGHELHESARMKSSLFYSCSFVRFVARSLRNGSNLLLTRNTTSHQAFSLRALSCFSWQELKTIHTVSFSEFIFRHSYKRTFTLTRKVSSR